MTGSTLLSVRDLRVSVEDREVIRGISFDIRGGEIVALMGPNGSGKSTLAHALMGHPRYHVTGGTVTWSAPGNRQSAVENRASNTESRVPNPASSIDILALKPEERARLGIFLSFQYPAEVSGVSLGQLLRTAVGERTRLRQGFAGQAGALPPAREFLKTLDEKLALLGMEKAFAERNVNEGFSGGEKKRAEILQLAVLEPTLALLDETDSGLDVDALHTVAAGIQKLREEHPEMAVLLITHYERFLEFLVPDRVLVMKAGQIVAEGGKDLAELIQQHGYEHVQETNYT